MRIYNSLSKKKENLRFNGIFKMYVCGITPYDNVHIGHARCYITYDVLRRYLEYKGIKVFYIQNLTDIDDKIITKAKEKNKSIEEIASLYTEEYFSCMDRLNIKRADYYPKVSEHIPEIVEFIKKLMKLGYAYKIGKDIYFDVGKLPNYGLLSKREDIKNFLSRIEPVKGKKDVRDFALWKSASDKFGFDTELGFGRPGWHIECSTLAYYYLGEVFDLHGGGVDLIFPHHENEIAQSFSLTGKIPAKIFMHNGFITINKEKMSKSLGNIFYLTKALQMYNPKVLRLFLLSCHYRHPLEFNPESINSMNSAYTRIENTLSKIDFYLKRRDTLDLTYDYEKFLSKLNELETNFHKFMDDDLNTEKALSEIFKFISFFNDYISQGEIHPLVLRLVKEYIIKLMNILGIELGEPKVLLGVNKLPERLVELILEIREDLRKNKDFNQADKIRSKLKELGITVEDTKYGPRYLFSNHYNLILK